MSHKVIAFVNMLLQNLVCFPILDPSQSKKLLLYLNKMNALKHSIAFTIINEKL